MTCVGIAYSTGFQQVSTGFFQQKTDNNTMTEITTVDIAFATGIVQEKRDSVLKVKFMVRCGYQGF